MLFYYFCVYGYLACLDVYVSHAWQVPVETRGGFGSPVTGVAGGWMLGIEPVFSGRAASALNHYTLSLTHTHSPFLIEEAHTLSWV